MPERDPPPPAAPTTFVRLKASDDVGPPVPPPPAPPPRPRLLRPGVGPSGPQPRDAAEGFGRYGVGAGTARIRRGFRTRQYVALIAVLAMFGMAIAVSIALAVWLAWP